MPNWICEVCTKRFTRCRTGKPIRFCSQKCYHTWRTNGNAGGFHKGQKPWNKNTAGLCKPNSGSFVKGHSQTVKYPIGTKTVRIDKNGKSRIWIKVQDNNNPYDWMLFAIAVWEDYNGSVPEGYIVHHKDRNTLNDDITNLELMTRAEHLMEHRYEYEEKRKEAAAKSHKR